MNNNYYLQSDMKYLDIAIVLEDIYFYGTKVKVSIPSLTPLASLDKDIENKRRINKQNIMNKNTEPLGIIDGCTTSNYIYLFIPKEATGYDQLHDHIHLKDIHEHIDRSHCVNGNVMNGGEYEHEYKPKGYKGDRFIIAYVGGDINKPYVIGKEE